MADFVIFILVLIVSMVLFFWKKILNLFLYYFVPRELIIEGIVDNIAIISTRRPVVVAPFFVSSWFVMTEEYFITVVSDRGPLVVRIKNKELLGDLKKGGRFLYCCRKYSRDECFTAYKKILHLKQ